MRGDSSLPRDISEPTHLPSASLVLSSDDTTTAVVTARPASPQETCCDELISTDEHIDSAFDFLNNTSINLAIESAFDFLNGEECDSDSDTEHEVRLVAHIIYRCPFSSHCLKLPIARYYRLKNMQNLCKKCIKLKLP
mgnify:CR=1 FL=1